MNAIRVEREGVLAGLGEQLHKKLAVIVAETALAIESDAKLLCPVDTGFLRNSIQYRPVADLEAEVVVGAEYGAYVEYGTYRTRPQPYLNPAFHAQIRRFRVRVRRAISDAKRDTRRRTA